MEEKKQYGERKIERRKKNIGRTWKRGSKIKR